MRYKFSLYKYCLISFTLFNLITVNAQLRVSPAKPDLISNEKTVLKNFVEVQENNQSISPVLQVFQTLDNIIWIVTEDDGLIEYNGSTFTHYRSGSGLYSLSSNRITYIFEEDKYSLWISTRNGICKFDRIKKQFILFSFNQQALEVFGIVKLTDGRLVCATNRGVCFINKKNNSLELISGQRIKNTNGIYYPGEAIQAAGNLLYDKDGSLWSNIITQNLQGLANFNFVENEWVLYPQERLYKENYQNPDKPENITTWFIYADDDGNRIWAGGFATGLRCFETKTKKWSQYYFENNENNADWNNTILTIFSKNENELLVGTYLGLNSFNTQTKQAFKYAPIIQNKGIDPGTAIHCITKDNCGNLWVGGQMGLLRIHSLNNRFSNDNRILNENLDIQSVLEYDDKNLVIADKKMNGLNAVTRILNISGGKVTNIKTFSPKNTSAIFPVVKLDRIGAGLISFSGTGIMTADSSFRNFKFLPINLEQQDGKISENILPDYYSVVKWDDSIFYACRRTTAELGFIKINIQSQTARQYKPAATPDNKHPVSGSIHWLYKDNYKRLWCCSDDHGLSIFYPSTGLFENYQSVAGDRLSLPSNIVRCVFQTSDGFFWISTNAGLCRSAAIPGKKAGFDLIVPGIECNFLIEDSNGNLWVNYKNGNIRVNIKTFDVQYYTAADGFYWAGYYSKKFLLKNGRFLMPDGEIFNPDEIPQNNFLPAPFISGVTINNKELIADSAFPFKKKIDLLHTENFISINYSCDSYVNEQKNSYEYKLTGIDTGWVKAGTRTTAYYTNLSPGTYHFWLRAANSDGIKGTQNNLLTINIHPAWYQTWWFKMLAVLIAVMIIFTLYLQRINQLKATAFAQRSEAELKQVKTEFEKKIAETEMVALRAQMNPHFIFNVLNSINKYILVNEGAKASHYLTQFSRLIRQVLENSKSSKVTLESDLQALQLYINMEKLRFEERFTCNIEIDKNIDQQFTQLPPLLIQPYAENAIWHGLMQKETPGHLEIIITQPQENTLQIIIKDNGIGRKKAVVLQSKSATIHKSFGMQITKDRIDIVNKIFRMQATVEYEDLYKDGAAAGTSVTLIIPV